MSRRDHILARLKGIVYDLSGIEPQALDPDATFLDMGFDSLFLTQANLGFRREFGVRVTFRQLFDEAPTLGSLAAYIDNELEDDIEVVGPTAPATGTEAPERQAARKDAGTARPVSVPTGSERSILRQILALQLQSTSALLAAIETGRGLAPPEGMAAVEPATSAGASSEHESRGADSSPQADATTASEPDRGSGGSHGPFRPVEKSRISGFDEEQLRFLEGFVERYQAKTRSSKELTRAHRDAFADPRAVAGFRQEWKEMVYPLAVDRSRGSKMWDVDGNEYVDAVSGFGAIFFGHAPDFVVEAVHEQLHHSLDYGPLSTIAGETAEMLCEATGMDRASFCNTGSEAVLAAMRTARTATGRDTIVTFQGDYHGLFDEVLVRRQDFGDRSRNVPVAPGIPRDASKHMVVLDYGAPESLQRIRELGPELAGVLVEPVQSRNPALQPREFLHGLRELCTELDVPLIFDEIITGFRVHPRGAQGWFGVQADIASYGKVVGGGMPIGIVAGKRRYMDALDGGPWQYGDDSFPEAGVTYFAGTFIRHPLSLAAVHAVLKHLRAHGSALQDRTNARTVRLTSELNEHFAQERIPIRLEHFGSVFLPRFGGRPELDTIFHRLLHYHGLHLWEGRPGFLTTAHSEDDVDRMIDAFKRAAAEMLEGGLLGRTDGEAPGRTAEPVPVPFTEPQEELWVAIRLNPSASPAYNEPVRLALEGELHVPALRRAVGQLIRRHDALRSTVAEHQEALVIHPAMPVDVPLVDLSGLEEEERERRRRAILLEEGGAAFDLVRGPLLRMKVLKLGPRRWDLLATVHHIACDGWSINIALRDLSRFYSAAVTGRSLELEPAMTLPEYRSWYEERRASDEAAEAAAYWLERFRDPPTVADLPIDHPRPADRSYNGARQALRVDAEVGEALKRLSSEHRCTLFTTVFAAFNVLLHRLTGEDDLVVGVPSAGQALLGENDLVAHCVHYLPIRTTVRSDLPFSDYLDALRSTVLDAHGHSEVTYGSLIKRMPIPRDRSRAPLLTAGFNLDPAMTGLVFHGLEWRYDPMPRRYCKLDLAVNVVETGGELLVEIDHNTDLIESETALRWGRHWATLLEAIVDTPDRPLSELPLLSDDERADAVPADRRIEPDADTVPGLIERCVDRVPDRPAVADEAGHALTYRELEARANRLAHHLSHLGVGAEEVVAVDLPRCVDLVVALVAIHKAGGAYLPLDDRLPPGRVSFMLDDAGARVALTVDDRAGRFRDFAGIVLRLDGEAEAIAEQPAERLGVDVSPDQLAYVIYTSGSTGTPKGVETTHRNVVHLLRGTDADVELSETDVMLAVTTLAFDQSVLQIFCPLTNGGSVIVAEAGTAADGRRLRELMDRTRTNLMKATPAVWRLLADSGWEGSPQLRAFSGGESLPADLARHLAAGCLEAWNHYGPTETTGHTTSWRIPREGAPVMIGRPLPNSYALLLDESLQPVPPGVPGELYIGGAGVARGYRNRPELTADRFIRDPFAEGPARLYRTGDICRRHADGNLEYLGRTDAQVKIRGFRIELGEVEAMLREHPRVADAAARILDEGTIDARLVAYVVFTPAADTGKSTEPAPTGSELRGFLRDRVPDYMVPGLVLELAELPLTPRGKVDRTALPDPFAPSAPATVEDAPPATEMERAVAAVWQEILGVPTVGRSDNFFELGGHSLLAVRAAARLKARTGSAVDPRALFFQTVQQLARSLDEAAGTAELIPSRE